MQLRAPLENPQQEDVLSDRRETEGELGLEPRRSRHYIEQLGALRRIDAGNAERTKLRDKGSEDISAGLRARLMEAIEPVDKHDFTPRLFTLVKTRAASSSISPSAAGCQTNSTAPLSARESMGRGKGAAFGKEARQGSAKPK